MTTMNRVIPIIGGIVLVIAIAVAVKSGERRPEPELMAKLPKAAAPDVDTPADTVRSLSAQVAQMVDQTRRLTEENQKLREQNAAAVDQEKRVADKVRAELANDIERASRQDDKTLTALSQQLEKLRSRIAVSEQTRSITPPLADMPVGFGYGDSGIAGAIHWIEALDAPAAGTSDQEPTFASLPGGSLLHAGSATREPDTLADAVLNPVRAVAGSGGKATPARPQVEPVYTIPANATLTQSTAFSALVGRTPVGGQVQDPMPFKVLIGADNLAANGHQIPGLEGMVMSGIAVGDWTLSCVRGTIQSATFVFDDGRVQTFGGTSRGTGQGANRQQEGLGWISDRFGVPCISGERITNAPTFLAQRIGVTALTAAAEAAAASQTTSTVSNEGTANTTVTGDQGEYVLGKTVSGGAQEIGTWLTERQASAFDAVFVAAGNPVVVHLDVTLPIDYDPAGRRLDHHARLAGPGGAYGYLD